MIRIQRDFTVNVPLAVAWQHLASVERWPSWAKHMKRVTLRPPGGLTAQSSGAFHLNNGIRSIFRMTEYNWHRNWRWLGRFLWLSVSYDHRFDAIGSDRTKLTWIVEVDGFSETVFGRVFAAVYRRNLDKAIPNPVSEMNALRAGQ